MQSYLTNDGYSMVYQVAGADHLPPLILLHGFTGSSAVWQRDIPGLSQHYHIIAPDLRGHGDSDKPPHGYHVSRLAMDLKNLLDHLNLTGTGSVRCIAGSLGCAILWSYAELCTANDFSHMVWVDQAPMQNYAFDGSWGPEYGNRTINTAASLAILQTTLKYDPDVAYRGTIAGCLGYLSHPIQGQEVSDKVKIADEAFFLEIARKGDPTWYGKLMADHTSLDWRDSIASTYDGPGGTHTKVLVVASSRSGCFPPKGVMESVELCNSGVKRAVPDVDEQAYWFLARGVVVDWGGHWCYWEDPEKFNALVLPFLAEEE